MNLFKNLCTLFFGKEHFVSIKWLGDHSFSDAIITTHITYPFNILPNQQHRYIGGATVWYDIATGYSVGLSMARWLHSIKKLEQFKRERTTNNER